MPTIPHTMDILWNLNVTQLDRFLVAQRKCDRNVWKLSPRTRLIYLLREKIIYASLVLVLDSVI